jgi:hypothetical protein
LANRKQSRLVDEDDEEERMIAEGTIELALRATVPVSAESNDGQGVEAGEGGGEEEGERLNRGRAIESGNGSMEVENEP